MRRLCLLVCILILCSGTVLAETLGDYPSFFRKATRLDAKIVVGDLAIASDTLGAVEIATSLQVDSVNNRTYTGIQAVLASEIEDVTKENLIVVGGPCANSVAAQLLNFPLPCYEGTPPNAALIQLFTFGEFRSLLVAGDSALDTRRGSRVIANYADYELPITTSMKVAQTSQREITVT